MHSPTILIIFCITFALVSTNNHLNVLETPLEVCSLDPLTGFLRSGFCDNDESDTGTHLVCAKVTNEFLEYSRDQGNDLITANSYFPGLKEGNHWCLCVLRWYQAYNAGRVKNMKLNLLATHYGTLNILQRFNLTLNDLKQFSSK